MKHIWLLFLLAIMIAGVYFSLDSAQNGLKIAAKNRENIETESLASVLVDDTYVDLDSNSRNQQPLEFQKLRAQAITLAKLKKWPAAFKIFKVLLKDYRDDDELLLIAEHDYSIVLSNAAISELKQGYLAKAFRLLERALVLEPEDKRLLSIKRQILLKQAQDAKENSEKIELYKEALEIDDSKHIALKYLAQLYEKENLLQQALASLEKLRDAYKQSNNPSLEERYQKKIEKIKKQLAVEGNFKNVEHEYFKVRFEGYAQEDFAYSALEVLERARYAVQDRLGLEQQQPITVLLYTGSQYKQSIGGPDWSSGLYDGKIRIREGQLALNKQKFENLLFHEYTHALVAQNIRIPLPGWFHEGLAQNMENQRKVNIQMLNQGKSAGYLLSREALKSPLSTIKDARTAQVAYQQSLSLIRFLVARIGVYSFTELVEDLVDAESFAVALQERAYLSEQELFQAWERSI